MYFRHHMFFFYIRHYAHLNIPSNIKNNPLDNHESIQTLAQIKHDLLCVQKRINFLGLDSYESSKIIENEP